MKLWHHIVSLIIALLAVGFIFNYQYQSASDVSDQFVETINKELKEFNYTNKIINYSKGYGAELLVNNYISDSSKIVIFGSSELAGNNPDLQVPYFFLNRPVFKKEAITVGNAGNQSMAILTQLMAVEESIEHSNLVFFVSPGWFSSQYSEGTSVPSFLEFNPKRSLLRIYFNQKNEDKYLGALRSYLQRNKNNLSGSSQVLTLIKEEKKSMSIVKNPKIDLYAKLNEKKYLELRKKDKDALHQIKSRKVKIEFEKRIKTPIDWDSLASEGEKYQKAQSTNNNLGIYNEYFSKYVNGQTLSISVNPIEDNQELRDFKLLVDYLKSRGSSKALFVILPIHPGVYKGIESLTPFVNEIESYTKQNSFEVLNMWVTDSTQYRIGTLTDVMHIGEVGWTTINQKIVEHFNDL